jgi:hypothetical protein
VPAPLLAAFPTGADLDPAAASGATEPKVTAPACASTEAKGDGTADKAGDAEKADKTDGADGADTAGAAQ